MHVFKKKKKRYSVIFFVYYASVLSALSKVQKRVTLWMVILLEWPI